MTTGSLMNLILSGANGGPTPEIGMGATVLGWTDRYAATVTKVSPSGKTVTVTEDTATRTDSNGMSESQEYRYEPNPGGRTWTARLTKRGWVSGSMMLRVGERRAYHDYSF